MDHLLISLLNTLGENPDPLETPLGAARWWAAAGIAMEGRPRFDASLSAALRQLRAALIRGLAGQNATVRVPFRGDASDAILFEVMHVARTYFAGKQTARIRRCGRQACGRYFSDETKNGSKRWCSLRCMERARAPRRRTIPR
jgi:predicted RNA-binding Zn ribbon-like protein